MSTLPIHSHSQRNSTRPPHQNIPLLIIEALVATMILVGIPISILASLCFPYPLTYHLAFLLVTSAIALAGSSCSAVQQQEPWVKMWYMGFEMPFLAEMLWIGYYVISQPMPGMCFPKFLYHIILILMNLVI